MKKTFTKILMALPFLTATICTAQFTLFNSGNSGLSNNACWYVNQSPSGKVWVATTNGGTYSYSGGTWTNYNMSNSNIAANYITPISFESNGDVWFGSYNSNAGISKFNGTTWTTYNTLNSGLAHDNILAVVFDTLGNKWIGTRGGGLNKFDGNTWITYNTSNSGIPSNDVYSLEIDKTGNIWVGTALAGLAKFNGTIWTTYNTSNSSLPNNDIYSLKYNTATNSLWIGTFGGLAVLKNTTWTVYNTTSTTNFPGNYVRGITHSQTTGNTYIATGSGGIGSFDGFSWKKYTTTNSNLPSNQVWSINTSNNGTLWASTIANGIVSMADVFSSVQEHSEIINEVSIFPNPAKNTINFNINTTTSGKGKILIYDALGKLVTETAISNTNSLNNNYSINTSLFSKGIYYYSLIFEGEQKSGKFIIE